MAGPGTYTVSLFKEVDGVISPLAEPKTFEVERMREGALEGASPEETVAFWREIEGLQKSTSAVSVQVRKGLDKLKVMQKALARATANPGDLEAQLYQLRMNLLDLDQQLNGNRAKQEIGEKGKPTVQERLGVAYLGTTNATYGPTPMHKRSLEIAQIQFAEITKRLQNILTIEMVNMEKALQQAGAPWMEGQALPIGE